MISEAYQNLVDNHVIEESLEDYNKSRSEYMSSTALKVLIMESPADLKCQIDNPEDDPKAAFILGNAVHTMFLEGLDAFEDRYVVGGPKNNQGVEYGIKSEAYVERWAELNAEGKELILTSQFNTVRLMRKSLKKHYLVKSIMKQGISESVLRTEYMGIKCQCRFDRLSPEWGIPDLKTCRDLHYFKNDARYKYGYYYSAGFYQSLAYHVAPEFGYLPFCFIVVESKPPYKVGVFNVPEEVLEYHRYKVMDALISLKECQESGIWPTGFEDLQTIIF